MAANEPGQPPVITTGLTTGLTTALTETMGGGFTANLPTPSSVLAIGAHPDDVEFGCGGLLAKWAADGCIVHHLICTDGSKGTWDVSADTAALALRRQDEQRDAARLLGGASAGEVRFLGRVDGELVNDLTTRSEVARVIRELRPESVLGHDPWKRYRLHPDHRNAGLIACDAIVAARDPHFFPEHGIAHHRPERLLLWEADQPNHVEDVTAGIDAKIAALHAHVSQFESTMHAVDDDQLDSFDGRIRSRLAELGRPHGLDAAELFHLMTDL
jgi:LmbE family N-acetylglucosaminyl deacetylase